MSSKFHRKNVIYNIYNFFFLLLKTFFYYWKHFSFSSSSSLLKLCACNIINEFYTTHTTHDLCIDRSFKLWHHTMYFCCQWQNRPFLPIPQSILIGANIEGLQDVISTYVPMTLQHFLVSFCTTQYGKTKNTFIFWFTSWRDLKF